MGHRPGFRSSEFIVALLGVIGTIAAALQDYITSNTAAHLSVYGAIAYVVSRGLAKYEPRPPVETKQPPPAA